ncbi:plasmid pRiA4b ORF-3 family protein [Vibrio anguillarum]|uniref:plasmid pRiA4b ORF-3 family protein n=1 Tax=Vibrio anguillarum TaxID=55601 RepID=UPI001D1815A0|nr:plasmid pRiA4b ORF-3 family protein [Vibrio anguillarum]MCC4238409.1 plasmid pRiA4b ORF-3 family protein [Vibrio anguillarum]
MIETLKIKLLSGPKANDWECMVEVPNDYCLYDLHHVIQQAVGFDDDHLFEFAIGRTYLSPSTLIIECDDDEINEKIESILPKVKGKKLFYMFDYGDRWLFQISKSRKKSFEARPNIQYPRLTIEVGVKPEQYPDWDDE